MLDIMVDAPLMIRSTLSSRSSNPRRGGESRLLIVATLAVGKDAAVDVDHDAVDDAAVDDRVANVVAVERVGVTAVRKGGVERLATYIPISCRGPGILGQKRTSHWQSGMRYEHGTIGGGKQYC